MQPIFKKLILTFSLLAAMSPGVALADMETLNSPNSDNLTVAGDNVYINDPVEGDLIVAGGSVMVNSNVSGDILGAAGNIDIRADVGGDVRVATGNLKLDGNIAGDMIAFAGEISVSAGSSIGQDVFMSAGQITMDGKIDGVANITAGNLQINGTVGDSTMIAAENIDFGDQAKIAGDLEYFSKNQIAGIEKFVEGRVKYQASPIEEGRSLMEGISQGINIFWMIAALFTGMMLLIFLPPLPIHATRSIKTRPFISYFTGVLTYLAIFPILIVMVTGIGLHLGFTFLATWVVLVTFSKLFVVIILGEWILQGLQMKPSTGKRFFAIAIAILVLSTVGKLPYLNGLIFLILTPLAMGAVIRSLPSLFNVVRSEPDFAREDIPDQMPTIAKRDIATPKKAAPKRKTTRKAASKRSTSKTSTRAKKK
jgi:cytoskeletal protein CcmA (bactofilin family)